MKSADKKPKLSLPIVILIALVGAYVIWAYALPASLTYFLTKSQSASFKKMDAESARLQATLSQGHCTLQTKTTTPGVDAPPRQAEFYNCSALDLAKMDQALTNAGFIKYDPISKKPYPAGNYSLDNGTLHDVINVGKNEIDLTITD